MGWGLGFDNKLKSCVSGNAKVFLDPRRLSAQTRNALRRSIETLFLPSFVHGMVNVIYRDTHLGALLPSMTNNIEQLYTKLSPEQQVELEATARMLDFNVYVTKDLPARLRVTISISSIDARAERTMKLKQYQQICEAHSLKYVVPNIGHAESLNRQELLNAIDNLQHITTTRIF
jgi:hypothetical protein